LCNFLPAPSQGRGTGVYDPDHDGDDKLRAALRIIEVVADGVRGPKHGRTVAGRICSKQ
jgi:hypothetical protein